jgi:hypothetical protein
MSRQQQKQAVTNAVAEAEEQVSFRLVDDLQSVGVNVQDIKKLQEAGYTTIGFVTQDLIKARLIIFEIW